MNDPYNLFPKEPAAPKATGGAGWLIPGILLGVVIAFGAQQMDFQIPWDWRGDFQEEKEDKKQDEAKVAAETLVFVHELNPKDIDHDLLLRDVQSKGWDYRSLDDDLEDFPIPYLKEWALTRGVSPPMVIALDKEGNPVRAASWPADMATLEKFRK